MRALLTTVLPWAVLLTVLARPSEVMARRAAVIVGANAASGRPGLAYAHFDAQRVAQVLEELSGVAAPDLHVLLEPTPAQVLARLEAVLAELAGAPDASLVFYYSGHAEARTLLLGAEALRLDEVRARMGDGRAAHAVLVLDVEGAGALGAPPQVTESPRAAEAPEGSVSTLEASAAAHESAQLHGAYFTHHWIAGLRGAGDDGDGVVTSREAFDYAQASLARGLRFTRAPTAPIVLALHGADQALTTLASARAHLVLEQDQGPLVVVERATGVVRVETAPGARRLALALEPGRYRVLAQRHGRTLGDEIALEPRGTNVVSERRLTAISRDELAAEHLLVTLDTSMEEPTRLARAELATWQTVAGVAAGASLCFALDCDDGAAFTFMILAGAGTGLGVALVNTTEGARPGEVLAINSGATWGFWQGLGLSLGADVDDSQRFAATVLAGQAVGTTVGVLAATKLHPDVGTVSLGNSAGIWSGALTLLGMGAWLDRDLRSQDALTLLVVSDVGLAAGLALGERFALSRGRVLVIDAGGVLGGLLGMSAVALVKDERTTGEQLLGAAAIGATVGLGASAALTHGWDAPDTEASLLIVPTQGGALLGIGGRF